MTGTAFPIDLRATVGRVRSAIGRPDAGSMVVVGDVMLDRYVDGSTTRLSPEAPVPVVDVHAELVRLGGAANVAAGLAALGARVVLVGVVGDDDAGARVRALLDAVPGIEAHLVVDPDRRTTTKERVRVDGRHIMRIDREQTDDPRPEVHDAIERATQDALAGGDVLVVSDYAKGAVASGLLAALTDRPVTVVDPKHLDVERYRGADVLAPNRAEAIAATSAPAAPEPPSLADAVAALHARLPGTAVVVTCGADGVVWSEHGTETHDLSHLPTLARHVVDVTGAGDSVVCGLAAALAEGTDLADAIALSCALAAVAVESPGTAAPTWDQVDALVAERSG
jgi:D-beta-D-heptose 7-phosphate kinase / D-beta-D-heptose 1-phosphate adenosyltransferase